MLKDKSRYELCQCLEYWQKERASLLQCGFDVNEQEVQVADAEIAGIRDELNRRDKESIEEILKQSQEDAVSQVQEIVLWEIDSCIRDERKNCKRYMALNPDDKQREKDCNMMVNAMLMVRAKMVKLFEMK